LHTFLKYLLGEKQTLLFLGLTGSILNHLKEEIAYMIQRAEKDIADIKRSSHKRWELLLVAVILCSYLRYSASH
jgi:hypothetical protein